MFYFYRSRYTIIENYQIESCGYNKIIYLFDGEREIVFNNSFLAGFMECFELNHKLSTLSNLFKTFNANPFKK